MWHPLMFLTIQTAFCSGPRFTVVNKIDKEVKKCRWMHKKFSLYPIKSVSLTRLMTVIGFQLSGGISNRRAVRPQTRLCRPLRRRQFSTKYNSYTPRTKRNAKEKKN